MALNDDTPRLGCGRRIDELWETIDQPLNQHERSCDQCQNARAALYNLAAVTEAMRTKDSNSPDLRPAGRVKEAIMMVARAEIRRGRKAPLRHTSLGNIDISEQALSGLVRFAADTIPGVHARRCSIETPTGTPTAEEPVDASHIKITVRVAMSSKVSIPPTTDLLRQRVSAVVRAQALIEMQQINVIVEDLYDL